MIKSFSQPYPVFQDGNFHYYQREFLFSNTVVMKQVVHLVIENKTE